MNEIRKRMYSIHQIALVIWKISLKCVEKQSNGLKNDDKLIDKLTSHGGGALRYDGTILNVTEPRASRCAMINDRICQTWH